MGIQNCAIPAINASSDPSDSSRAMRRFHFIVVEEGSPRAAPYMSTPTRSIARN